MSGSISTLRQMLIAKRATTYKVVPSSMLGTGFLNFQKLDIKFDPMRIDKNNQARRVFGNTKPQFDPAGSGQTVSFETSLYRVTSPGSLPTVSELLWACGLKETVTGGVNVQYTPQTAIDVMLAQSSYLEVHKSGHNYVMNGARGTFTLTGNPKDGLVFKFELHAGYTDPVVDADSQPRVGPPMLQLPFTTGTLVTQAGYAIDISSFEFNYGGKIDKAISSGGMHILLTDIKPTLKIDPLALATQADVQQLMAATEVSFNLSVGSGAFILQAVKCVRTQTEFKEREGRFANAQTFEIIDNAPNGDDCFTMTFA
ncbi:hypothetical protein SIID45300_01746 [Candidatus Magnetaquicoccaceae bacterium FCR-1]|uniref:Capsid protein n=1 Tax=Candidatus Magnetaquiglobus chichijimensis TaxID=3141448 RepID=A0ABQ0C961_9PROT